jgi:signal transduction histidine kinase
MRTNLHAYLPFLFLACINLLLIGLAGALGARQPYFGVECQCRADVYIIATVHPDGPASRAGIQPGDQILAVDGQRATAEHSPWHGNQIGQRLDWTVLRSGAQLNLTIMPERRPLDQLLEVLQGLVVGLFFWAISLGVWVVRPFHQATRLFFLASQVLASSFALVELKVVWPGAAHLVELLLLLLAPLALHVLANFPDQLERRWRRPLLRLAYGSAALTALLTLLRLWLVPGLPRAQLWLPAFALEDLILLLALVLLFRPRRTAPLQVRRRHHLLIFGMVAGLAPMLLLSLLPVVLWGTTIVHDDLTRPFLVLMPLTYAYALLSGELGRADFFLNRGLVYLLLSALVLSLYVLLSLALEYFLDGAPWSSLVGGVVLALLMMTTFEPLRARLQRQVDRLFYGGWYDYRSVVRTASQELSQTLDRARLSERLLAIAQTMRFQQGALFWPRGDALVFEASFGTGGVPLIAGGLPTQGPLAGLLASGPRPCWQSELRSELADHDLTTSEHHLLADERVQLWLPLVSRGQLRGVLLLGARQGDEPSETTDLDILATVAGQAAVAAENVTLLETLQARIREGEQMREELAEAQRRLAESREAERLHLAQELHDGPIQDLYGARFQLGILNTALPDPQDQQHLTAIEASLETVTSTLRTICSELRPPALAPFGLEMALRSHAERFAQEHPDLTLHLDLMPDGQTLSERLRLTLFRICQQALNNIARHARASTVTIRLHLTPEVVTLEIEDDGQGFHVPDRWLTLARQGHFGLLGAAERATTINAHFQVRSTPGTGTLVRVVAPRPTDPAADGVETLSEAVMLEAQLLPT